MIPGRFFRHYMTAKASKDRISEKGAVLLDEKPDPCLPAVSIDPSKRFQIIEGFGGAFTESGTVSLARMRKEHREQFFKAYFHPTEGHGYSLCRTHMNSCDFSLGNYACTEVDGDVELKHFSIERDRQSLLPMIKEAQKIIGEPLKILVSPWSPPAWMKTNGQVNGGGKLKPEYRQIWANYFVRFIQEYEKEGVPIWGVTVQNEPAAVQVWDSCLYSAEEERDFVRDYLGPTFQKAGLERIKIIIWDHNRDLLIQRIQPVYNDLEASKYIWGAAFHWYGPGEVREPAIGP